MSKVSSLLPKVYYIPIYVSGDMSLMDLYIMIGVRASEGISGLISDQPGFNAALG